MRPTTYRWALHSWPPDFTPEQLAAIRRAIADGVLLFTHAVDEAS